MLLVLKKNYLEGGGKNSLQPKYMSSRKLTSLTTNIVKLLWQEFKPDKSC